jgi:hypothetical protein
MARANGRRNLHVLDTAIALYNAGSAGTRSGAEDAFLALIDQEPRVNTDLHGFEVDFHWPELKLAVEIDGPHHGRPRDRDADARQDRALQAAGYDTLHFHRRGRLPAAGADQGGAQRSSSHAIELIRQPSGVSTNCARVRRSSASTIAGV